MLYVARVFVVVVVLGSEIDGAFDFHYLWHAVVRAIAYRDNTCIMHARSLELSLSIFLKGG